MFYYTENQEKNMNPIGMSKPSANSIPPRPQKPLGPLIIIKPVKVIISRDKMKISENTVKTHKKRAYQFVRERLGESLGIVMSLLFV